MPGVESQQSLKISVPSVNQEEKAGLKEYRAVAVDGLVQKSVNSSDDSSSEGQQAEKQGSIDELFSKELPSGVPFKLKRKEGNLRVDVPASDATKLALI